MNLNEPIDGDNPDYSKRPKIQTDSSSTSGMIFGFVVAICAGVVAVMLTVKLGLVLFT